MFKLIKTGPGAKRRGLLKTAHGSIATPFFMPDATRGFIKLIDNQALLEIGTPALVVNTFHLSLRPGLKIISQAGGVHKFMNWTGPLLSDSGGFQVFSLIHQRPGAGRINDQGVKFKSPLDGSSHELSPEKSIQIQFALGVDMMVCLDDCPPHHLAPQDLSRAVARTISWARRCKSEYKRQLKKSGRTGLKRPLLFAVIQGGTDLGLRAHCTRELVKIGFDGYGFGARPIDQSGRFLEEVLRQTASFIPQTALRFALGVGTPEDIVRCVRMGWDMFDCVIPTREGRHGKLFLSEPALKLTADSLKYQSLNINNSAQAKNQTAINRRSRLAVVKNNSRAYLHHLFKMQDPLGPRLASLNNLEFYQNLMNKLSKR